MLGEEILNTDNSKEKESGKPQEEGVKDSNGDGVQQMEVMEEDEGEEMELGELDLDLIDEECRKKGKGYVPRCQIELLQEAIIKTGVHQDLGIDSDQQKGSKRKSLEEELRIGRKTNKQRIAAIGVNLIESGQYPTIRATFSEVREVFQ